MSIGDQRPGPLLAVMLFATSVACRTLVVVVPGPPQQQPERTIVVAKTDEKGRHLVGNVPISSALVAAGEQNRISGRVSFHLVASESSLANSSVLVRGFNVVYFGVPQRVLAGDIPLVKELGVLGFAAKSEKPQRLEYDAQTGHISGTVRGYVDASYMAPLDTRPADDAPGDFVRGVSQAATLAIELQLERPIDLDSESVVEDVRSELKTEMQADSGKHAKRKLAPFQIESENAFSFDTQIANWWWLQVVKRLCVQPVRIARTREIHITPHDPPYIVTESTGVGLSFGQPGADTEWDKADVVFSYRDWITIWDSSYWVVGSVFGETSVEETNLKNEVDEDDCIEVFFIDDFDPVDAHGCGASWGIGTAGAKIISTDRNARGGVDFTHLAHELGHAMGLGHPPGNSSTGTLMCPSGCLNDNPKVNSQENEDNLSNPLFRFAIKFGSFGPDCVDSADCGDCPPIP